MAFAQNLRHIFSRASSASPFLQSQLSSIRLNTTLTSPKLFVSGLSRQTTDEKLKEAFAPFGQLVEAKVVVDRPTGRSKGFGFVTYANVEDAQKASQEMNAKFLDGWVIFVDPAKPREPRPPPQHETQPQQSGFSVNKTVGWCGQ